MKLNKTIGDGIDEALNNGFKIKIDIPGTTLLATSCAVIITSLIIIAFSKYVKQLL